MDSVLSIESYIQGYGSECDFHFCYGLDLIEEDAINEKCCLEVLRNLIGKADSEILQLEDDMAILQSQLKWAEHDKYGELYEVWCATFKEKINSLSLSIHSLRNEKFFGGNGLSAELVTHRQPAQRISAIIGTLLRHHFPEDYKQVRELSYGENVLADNSLTNSDTEVKGQGSAARVATSDASNSGRKTIPERGTEGLDNTKTSRSAALQRLGRDEDAKRSEVTVMEQSSSSLYAKKEEIKVGEASDDDIELATLDSLAKPEDHDGEALKEFESLSTDIPIAKNAISDVEPIVNLMLKPQGLKGKRKLLMDLGHTNSLDSPHAEIRRNSVVKEGRRQQQQRSPKGRMMTPASEPKRQLLCGDARGRTSNAASNSKTARGMHSKLVQLSDMKDSAASSEFESQQGVAGNGKIGKHSIIRFPSSDDTKNIRLLSSQEPLCFHNLTLNQLKGIAKQHNVKGYAKLKKSLLAELLAKQLGE
ncbi:hypothetical protein Ancab_031039 [Ancistrocladus abbreviatus]